MESTVEKVEKVKALARKIAKESPTLGDLSGPQLERIAEIVMVNNLTGDLGKKVQAEKVDLEGEIEIFLKNASRTGSEHTRLAYSKALDELRAWAETKGLGLLEMQPRAADDFIYALTARGRSSSTTHLVTNACSAFFTFLERRHDFIRNPFRGTRARPVRKTVRTLAVPDRNEVAALIKNSSGILRAAIGVMAWQGLRVGALPGLTRSGRRFKTISKGREVMGELTKKAINALEEIGGRAPFASLTVSKLEERFRYLIGKLFAAGVIRAKYSVHDLRHFFAVAEYTRTKDIYQVKMALGHSSISTTEKYLRSLGEDL